MSRQRPADLDPGILYTNFADQQIGVMDAAGDPMDLVAVRFFRTTAEYIVGEMVHHNASIYKCVTPTGPGAFTAAHWTNISEPTEAPIDAAIYGRSSGAWVQTITKTNYDIDKAATDAALALLETTKATLASPALTGNPTAPTAAPGDNDSTLATTAFVTAAVNAALTGGTPSIALDDLTDVDAATPTDGQVLTYDGVNDEWVPETPVTGVTTLDALTDVNAPAPTVGQVLTWDDTPGEWVAATPATVPTDLDDLADVNAAAPANGDVLTWDSTPGEWVPQAPAAVPNPTESLVVAASDETTALTTGTAKTTFRMPYAFTLSAVRASLTTAQASGSTFTVDINESGTSILSTKLTIDNTEKTSTTAATPAVISDASLADDAEITIDIDQVGTGAAGLKVTFIGTRV